MSTLSIWAERAIRVVENGVAARRIRLTTEGQVWDTWESPFPPVAEWCEEAEALKNTLAEEFPVRSVTLLFTAEDATGGVLSQLPVRITGRNKQASEIGREQHAKAQSDAMASLASTMEAVLRLARTQCETSGMQLEKQAAQILELVDLHRAKQEAELLSHEQANGAQEVLLRHVTDAAPMLLQALQHFATKKPSGAAAATLQAVQSLPTKVTP